MTERQIRRMLETSGISDIERIWSGDGYYDTVNVPIVYDDGAHMFIFPFDGRMHYVPLQNVDSLACKLPAEKVTADASD